MSSKEISGSEEISQFIRSILAEHDQQVAAQAWDEGYWQGINGYTGPGNPYINLRESTVGPSISEKEKEKDNGMDL